MVKRVLGVAVAATLAVAPAGALATPKPPPFSATAVGTGGAVSTVDPYASRAAIDVLESGGNAVDAAIAAAAVLGVVEPYSCGIGGGGFMVIHTADGRSTTIDSRETAPAAFKPDTFIDPQTGRPYPFSELVTSGLGVGVPGTVRGWELALRRYGTRSLNDLVKPAEKLAQQGFVVDPTFTAQTEANRSRFADFTSTRETFLTDDGRAPAPGTVLKNRDMASVYKAMRKNGAGVFYSGAIARAIVDAVRNPPTVAGTSRNVRPGLMTLDDLRAYRALEREPTRTSYRGVEVVGMGPPSSGGSTIGEALNILENLQLSGMSRADALHFFLDASRLAFADRGAYLGDPAFVDVPLRGLLSDAFAAERFSLIGDTALAHPQAAGNPWPHNGTATARKASRTKTGREGRSTTHLTVSDRFGNVVSYTFTIEQTGGSGIVVPGLGFLLNNELTDFEPVPGLANSPAAGKRPRSSMSPTIVLRGGEPLLALGSPGGSTIITTVLQILVDRLDLGTPLAQAVAAPRLTQRNTPATLAEPAFLSSPDADALRARGHTLAPTSEIGAATAIEFLPDGRVLAAAEPTRRGGGSAMVESQGK